MKDPAMKLLCRLLGHKLNVAMPRGKQFVRDGVVYETRPTASAYIECRRCGEVDL